MLFAVQQGVASPASRYRVFQYLPHLVEAGFSCTVLQMQGSASTRRSIHVAHAGRLARLFHAGQQLAESQVVAARLVRRAERFDRLYLCKIPLPEWAVRRLSRHRSRILFDLDDAWDAPEGDGSTLARLRRRFLERSFERAVRVASVVVVSNQRNATTVRRMGGEAVVVPTTVDLQRAVYRDRAGGPVGSAPILGWIGTPSTARYLALIEPALVRLQAQAPVVVRLIGSGPHPFGRLQADVREWSRATEGHEVAEFDIGLMPMPDTEWTRGKAALKALQYGASGCPTVATWTATNEAILGREGGVAFCRSEDDWVRELGGLVADSARRGELGRKGRQVVEERYSVQVQAPRLVRLIVGAGAAGTDSRAGRP